MRAYVALDSLAEAPARLAALRSLTVELLASPEPALAESALAESALAELVAASDEPLLTVAEAPAMESLVSDPGVRIGIRVGLLALLEARGLVGGPPSWARLLSTASGPEQRAAIRAAGAHPSPEVTAELLRLLRGGDSETAAEAAVALGSPGNDAAIGPLTVVLSGGDPRLGRSAVRGLGRIATAHAREALRIAAASHPDPDVRRRAQAQLRMLAERE